ncbi:hypothetical protein KAH85_00800 [Candidatus Bathyarchaeota archaeon]|nr:hypothetical protein [Candidatus Bathyarchaeota archaeon]MCK5631076.1 hypothetical protein [Candidatus Bathyarchaeota archaeon]
MSQRKTFEIKCSDCGKNAMVPFKPTPGKPAYCRMCFSKRRSKQRPRANIVDLPSPRAKAWARR